MSKDEIIITRKQCVHDYPSRGQSNMLPGVLAPFTGKKCSKSTPQCTDGCVSSSPDRTQAFMRYKLVDPVVWQSTGLGRGCDAVLALVAPGGCYQTL